MLISQHKALRKERKMEKRKEKGKKKKIQKWGPNVTQKMKEKFEEKGLFGKPNLYL